MVQDYSFYFDILSNVRKYNGTLTFAKNVELIRALPLEESRAIICSWLQSVEENPPIDFEMVRCAAWVCTSIPKLDEDIVAWVKPKPTELRYAIGCNFITGLWGGSGHIASDACLEFLIGAIDNDLDRQTDAYAYALTALSVVADPVNPGNIEEERQRELCGILLTHLAYLEEHHLHPDVAESLASLKDFDTRRYYAIFDKAKDLRTSVFDGKEPSEVIGALVKWLEVWSKPGCFDEEHMWYAGHYLGRVYGEGVDKAVCEWLQGSPSTERYLVAGIFLHAYWHFASVICRQCMDMLKEATAQFDKDTRVHHLASLALSTVAERQRLQEARQ